MKKIIILLSILIPIFVTGCDPSSVQPDVQSSSKSTEEVETGAAPVHDNATLEQWIQWTEEHAQTIQLTSTDYNDLHFIQEKIGDARIVFLGESSHTVSEYNVVKTRLVEFLHQEMGFEVLTFEAPVSSMHSAYYEGQPQSSREMDKLAPSHWQRFEEILPLYEYILRHQLTDNPLILSGIDIPPAREIDAQLFYDWIVQVDHQYAAEVRELERKFVDLYNWIARPGDKQIPRDFFIKNEEQFSEGYHRLLAFFHSNETKLKDQFSANPEIFFVMKRVVENRIHIVDNVFTNDDYYSFPNNLRDAAMADNLTWLAEELYPDKKIIVWAHNYHIRRNNSATFVPLRPEAEEVETMGGLIPRHLQDESYYIGLYMGGGTALTLDRENEFRLQETHAKGSLEWIMMQLDREASFIDIKHVQPNEENAWLFNPTVTLIGGADEVEMVLADQYDGILFIQDVNPPTPLWD